MTNPNKLKFKDSSTLAELGSLGADHYVMVRTPTGFAVVSPSLLGGEGGGGGGSPFVYQEWDAAADEVGVGMPIDIIDVEVDENPAPVVDQTAKTITFPAAPDSYQGASGYIRGKLPSTGKHWFAIGHDNNQGLSDLSLMIMSESPITGSQVIAQLGVYGEKVLSYTGGYEEHITLSATPGMLILFDMDAVTITVACDDWTKEFAFRAPIDPANITFALWMATYDDAATHVITINNTNAAAAPATVPVGYVPMDLRMASWPDVTNGTVLKVTSASRIGSLVLNPGDTGVFYNDSLLRVANFDKLMRSDAPAFFTQPVAIQGALFSADWGTPRVGDAFRLAGSGQGGVALGTNLGNKVTTGAGSTLLGSNIFGQVVNLAGTIAIGGMIGNTTGKAYESIVMGNYAGEFTGFELFRTIIIGNMAGNNPYAVDTAFTGDYANGPFTQWYDVIAIGDQALYAGRMGNEQIAIGRNAGSGDGSVTNGGDRNISIGTYAMQANGNDDGITTQDAIAIGSQAMQSGKGNADSVAIGNGAMRSTEGYVNIGIGRDALQFADGMGNVAIGDRTLSNSSLTQCYHNTAVGNEAMYNLGVGTNNSSAIGHNATVTGSFQVQLGGPSTTTYAYGAVQNRSDIRDKADVRDTVLGLEFILKLRPRDWRWDMREDYIDLDGRPVAPKLPNPLEAAPRLDPTDPRYAAAQARYIADQERYVREMRQWSTDQAAFEVANTRWLANNNISTIVHDGSKKRSRYHHGLVAQEVKEVIEEMGLDFGGYQDHALSGGKDVKSIGYEELIGPLIRSVQELSAQLKTAQDELADLKQQLGA